MAIPKYEKIRNLRKYLFCLVLLLLGICIGLLAAWGFLRGRGGQGPDAGGTNVHTHGAGAGIAGANTAGTDANAVGINTDIVGTDAAGTNAPETQSTDLIVDYPFPYSYEDWRLVLHETVTQAAYGHSHSGREFRLYNGDGQLVQTFPCILEAEELTFRFDHLFHSYNYNTDLVIFPADADKTGAKGLCYPWEDKTEKFSEYPVEIPWYQGTGSGYDNAFITTETREDTIINTICRINTESRQVVELRKWVLLKEEQDNSGNLRILDCLSGQDLYWGDVELNSLGDPVNDKYYQYLFSQNVDTFWKWTNDIQIETTKVTQDGHENVTYQNREELLADCGFQGKEPFYEYYDSLHHLELELYFDEQTGHGCGISYMHNYNYALEQVIRCRGFAFVQVEPEKWEPEDTFSTLSIRGESARADDVSGYKEIYEYTDDGKLSSFEARGIIVDYGESKEKTESVLLSMDYVYRSDGTLYHKQYHHNLIQFGSYLSSQSCYYDEQGRIVCKYCYTTSGSISYYYIYRNNSKEPAYCLTLDSYGGQWPEMISYGK